MHSTTTTNHVARSLLWVRASATTSAGPDIEAKPRASPAPDTTPKMVTSSSAPSAPTGITNHGSVFKLKIIKSSTNFNAPWTKLFPTQSFATAWAYDVERKLILTNHHCVEDAVSIRVKKPGSAEQAKCTVLGSSADCDLALLRVEEDWFWEGIKVSQPGGARGCRQVERVGVLEVQVCVWGGGEDSTCLLW